MYIVLFSFHFYLCSFFKLYFIEWTTNHVLMQCNTLTVFFERSDNTSFFVSSPSANTHQRAFVYFHRRAPRSPSIFPCLVFVSLICFYLFLMFLIHQNSKINSFSVTNLILIVNLAPCFRVNQTDVFLIWSDAVWTHFAHSAGTVWKTFPRALTHCVTIRVLISLSCDLYRSSLHGNQHEGTTARRLLAEAEEFVSPRLHVQPTWGSSCRGFMFHKQTVWCLDQNICVLWRIIAAGRLLGMDSSGISMLCMKHFQRNTNIYTSAPTPRSDDLICCTFEGKLWVAEGMR